MPPTPALDLPVGARYVTPLGDRREVSVPCWACRRPTFALDATCDPCDAAAAARLATRASRTALAGRQLTTLVAAAADRSADAA